MLALPLSVCRVLTAALGNPHLTSEEEVRFKANGLDSIEVQDNGHGISKENYDTVGKGPAVFLSLPFVHPCSSAEALYLQTLQL